MDEELKAHLEAMEERLSERIHDTETRLLRAFADYHTGWDNRFKRIEVSDATIAERLAALENRVLRLETKQ
jgi:predicted nuclease with TOPRIM domain